MHPHPHPLCFFSAMGSSFFSAIVITSFHLALSRADLTHACLSSPIRSCTPARSLSN
jgi:hypothetical protein